mmetsp:Transcript_7977/g.13243  ORF Transcript_7977/g.13243 Transcript_7977/m.13243 type:complete len:148 (-) Transcript_7977:1766-2209(-)
MQNLSISFFIDYDAAFSIRKTSKDEARGHLLLLTGNEADNQLAIASLLDGSSIDFLFGVKHTQAMVMISKANDVKKFMRSLDDDGQDAIVKFYFVVFSALVRYHKQMEHICAFLWESWLIHDAKEDIMEAFGHLQSLITEKNVISDD